MVYLIEAVKTLIGACEREMGVSIAEVAAKTTVGITRTGVIKVSCNDDGIGGMQDIGHEVIGLLVPQYGLIYKLTEGMPRTVSVICKARGLEMNIEEANSVRTHDDISEELFVIGFRVIALGHANKRIATNDSEVEDFVLTAIAYGIGVIGEGGFDAIPTKEVIMRAFLKTDDICIFIMCEISKSMKDL